MLKRYLLASLVAGLTLGAQSATATDLWFYPGHGWLAQPPFSSESNSRSDTIIAGPASAATGSSQRRAVKTQTGVSPRTSIPAPYDKPDQGYFN